MIGAADPGASLEVTVDGQVLTTTANQAGIWEIEVTLPEADGEYSVKASATAGGFTTEAVETWYLVKDTQAPDLDWVQTDSPTNSLAVNPWIQTGDETSLVFQTDEPLAQSVVYGELGNHTGSSFVVSAGQAEADCDGTMSGVELQTADLSAECLLAFKNTTQFESSLVILRPLEGAYYPFIHLEDLAGNRIWYTNYENLDGLTIIPFEDERNADDINQILASSSLAQNGNSEGAQALPVAYPYSPESRSRSLDFRFFIDNTRPEEGELLIPPEWGDKLDGVVADHLNPETDRLLTDYEYFENAECGGVNNEQLIVNNEEGTLTDSSCPRSIYSISAPEVTISGTVERNQRFVLAESVRDPNPDNLVFRTGTIYDAESFYDCRTTDQEFDQKVRGNLVTKFKDQCTFDYTKVFPDDGASPNGEPENWYSWAFYPIDLAGNTPLRIDREEFEVTSGEQPTVDSEENNLQDSTSGGVVSNDDCQVCLDGVCEPCEEEAQPTGIHASIFSDTVTVYHDEDNPDYTAISSVKSASYDPIVDWHSSNQRPITKDTSITSTHAGERKADVEYRMSFSNRFNGVSNEKLIVNNGDISSQPDGVPDRGLDDPYTRTLWNGFNDKNESSWGQQDFELGYPPASLSGEKRDDSSADCMTMHGTRRVGTCNDGIYTLNLRMTDTAGNLGAWVSREVERDTVDPLAPQINVTKNGDIFGEYLGLSISGELNTTATIQVTSSVGENRELQVKLDGNGKYSTTNLIGKLRCDYVTYSVKVKLTDRAENIGDWSDTKSVETQECPRCSTVGNGEFSMPVFGDQVRISAPFGFYYNTNSPHYGVDFAAPMGTPIYAADDGKVKVVNMGYPNVGSLDNPDGWANVVIIDHENGLYTIYAHLLNEAMVSVGQRIQKGQQIGKMGSSGTSSGSHLHFQVEDISAPGRQFTYTHIGAAVNPSIYLGEIEGNLTPEQEDIFCTNDGHGNNQDESYNSHPEITEDQALDSISWYIDNNLGGKTVLENSTNKWELKTKDQVTWDGQDDNLTDIRNFIELKQECRVWYYDFQEIYDGGNNKIGFDGVIVANPYPDGNGNMHSYIVKDEIWRKYQKEGMMCHAVGVPRGGEEISVRASDTIAHEGAVNQKFENTAFKKNTIHFYRHGWFGEKTATHFVVNQIAETYEGDGGTWGKWKMPTGDTYSNNYCKQWFEGGEIVTCQFINKSGTGIEQPFYVRNENPGEWKTEDDVLIQNVNHMQRAIVFEMVPTKKTNENLHLKDKYDGESQVWIVSHGWYANPEADDALRNYMKEYAQLIASQNPNDIVLLLDWREASGATDALNVQGTPVNRAAKWIVPVAKEAANKLKSDWGLYDGSRINYVGHSLGTLMSAEIAREMGKGNNAFLLDPAAQTTPEEALEGKFRDYDLDGNTSGEQAALDDGMGGGSYFRNQFNFSRAFVGQMSVAGDYPLSKTANQAFSIDYGSPFDTGAEHSWVTRTWHIINDEKPFGDYLTNKDLGNNYPRDLTRKLFISDS